MSPYSETISTRDARWLQGALFALWGVMLLPAVRGQLESSMSQHMLLQFPILIGSGALLAMLRLAVDREGSPWRYALNAGGAAGICLAAILLMLWMLPRNLDAALASTTVDASKFVCLVLSGYAICRSWPRVPAIARVFVHLEVIATLARFGWGFWAAPNRLCANYLLDAQIETGQGLLIAAVAYSLAIVWRPLFGRAENAMERT